MEGDAEKKGPRERKLGLSKEQFEIGKEFEFTKKELEELFDPGLEKV
jgi:hypothetical protein